MDQRLVLNVPMLFAPGKIKSNDSCRRCVCVCVHLTSPLEKYPVGFDDDDWDGNLQVINLVVRLLHHHRMIIMLSTSTCSIIFPNRSQKERRKDRVLNIARGQDLIVFDDPISLASPYTWRFGCFSLLARVELA